eukprot:7635964-Pyramimonas_sp.AAC.1
MLLRLEVGAWHWEGAAIFISKTGFTVVLAGRPLAGAFTADLRDSLLPCFHSNHLSRHPGDRVVAERGMRAPG